MTAKIYYYGEVPNWGDRLAVELVRYFCRRDDVAWSDIGLADAIVTGSILEQVPPGWKGIICGAGRLVRDSRLNLDQAKVLAVRGPYSAQDVPGDFALGDPGLLADELVTVATRDRQLGILPHWTDTRLAHQGEFQEYNPLVISPFRDPLEVIAEVGRCEKLVTSSLHGLICADAFGIPVRFEKSPRLLPEEGGLFKVNDYSASIGTPLEPGVTRLAHLGLVEDRKHEIYDAVRLLGTLLKSGG